MKSYSLGVFLLFGAAVFTADGFLGHSAQAETRVPQCGLVDDKQDPLIKTTTDDLKKLVEALKTAGAKVSGEVLKATNDVEIILLKTDLRPSRLRKVNFAKETKSIWIESGLFAGSCSQKINLALWKNIVRRCTASSTDHICGYTIYNVIQVNPKGYKDRLEKKSTANGTCVPKTIEKNFTLVKPCEDFMNSTNSSSPESMLLHDRVKKESPEGIISIVQDPEKLAKNKLIFNKGSAESEKIHTDKSEAFKKYLQSVKVEVADGYYDDKTKHLYGSHIDKYMKDNENGTFAFALQCSESSNSNEKEVAEALIRLMMDDSPTSTATTLMTPTKNPNSTATTKPPPTNNTNSTATTKPPPTSNPNSTATTKPPPTNNPNSTATLNPTTDPLAPAWVQIRNQKIGQYANKTQLKLAGDYLISKYGNKVMRDVVSSITRTQSSTQQVVYKLMPWKQKNAKGGKRRTHPAVIFIGGDNVALSLASDILEKAKNPDFKFKDFWVMPDFNPNNIPGATKNGVECCGVTCGKDAGIHIMSNLPKKSFTFGGNPCDRMYPGRKASTAPETKQIEYFINEHLGNLEHLYYLVNNQDSCDSTTLYYTLDSVKGSLDRFNANYNGGVTIKKESYGGNFNDQFSTLSGNPPKFTVTTLCVPKSSTETIAQYSENLYRGIEAMLIPL